MAGPTDPGRSDRRPETRSLAARLGERLGADVDPDVCLDPDPGAAPSAEVLRRLATHSPQGTRYAVRGEIARGGMGVILRVRDEDLRRNLAMKVMLGQGEAAGEGDTPEVDPALLTRFLEEAQLTGQLDHPGIVPVHELGLDADGRVYFTMRLVKGRELKEILAGEGDESWSRTRTLGVFLRICETLAYAHEKGVIHRDLKPANVMVGRFGEVYVMDWGLAKLLDREDDRDLRVKEPESSLVRTDRHDAISDDLDSPLMTMAGTVVGTPTYMSPEQASGRVEDLGPKSDVYAVGAMLYHLLAGHQPYVKPGERVSPLTVLNAVRNGPPQPIHEIDPRVPAELVAICEKAMARELDERYASMAELAEDLRRYLEDRVVLAHRTGALIELRKWVARNRLAAGTAAAALVLVAGLTVFFLQRVTRQRDRAVAAEANERSQRIRAQDAERQIRRLVEDEKRQRRVAVVLWKEAGRDVVQGRLDQAIGKYEQAIELVPEYVSALNDLGQVYIQKSWYSRAIGVFERAINVNPDFLDPRSGMAEAYYYLKNYDQSIAEASAAIEAAPDFEWPYYWRGMSRFQMGEIGLAEQDLATATRKNRRLGVAHLALGEIHAQNGLIEKAERRYRAALDADPDLISVYGSWAHLEMAQKDWDAAFELLKGALQKAPRTAWLHTQMGMVCLARGARFHSQGDKEAFRRETERSMDHFKTALRFDRTDRDASLGLKEARRRLAAVD